MKKTISRIFVGVMTAAMLIGASVLGVSAATATATQPCDGAHEGWTKLTNASAAKAANWAYDINTAGKYYLTEDITANQLSFGVAASAEITLCLNGHSIISSTDGPLYFGQGKFILCNCVDDQGGIVKSSSARSMIVGSGGTVLAQVDMYDNVRVSDATLSSNSALATAVAINKNGALTMYGGSVSNNKITSKGLNVFAAAVSVTGGNVAGGGKLVMKGGEISGNTVTMDCSTEGKGFAAAVYANSAAQVELQQGASICDNEVSSTGNVGGGILAWGSTVTMSGGTISGNTILETSTHSNGGGIAVAKSTLNMTDGTISDNQAKNGGGVWMITFDTNPSTFNMSGGTISGNKVAGSCAAGGGVLVNGSAAELNMTGGSIMNNTVDSSTKVDEAKYCGGGGVFVQNSGKVQMTDGTISGNTQSGAYGYGGGVFVKSGTFSMGENAVITGNTGKNGGGIYTTGTVTMTGGTISGNTAGGGGGIYTTGTVTMTGGTISNNTGADYNHGIHVASGSFTMNGKNARIEEDDKGAVYSAGNGIFNLVEGTVSTTGSRGALITNGKITVSGGQVYGAFEEGGQPERIVITGGKFSRDPSAYVGTSNKGAVIAVANTGSDKNTYPYQVIISSHSHADDAQGTTWNYIAKAGQITVPGHYYLAGDIVSGQINIKPEASPVTLCLNGHNISSTDIDFPLYAEGDIKLCNCSATSGNISGGKTRTAVFGGGTQDTATNAEIYDNVHFDNGALGDAAQEWVGMLMVNPFSTLTMYGGTVSNNKVTAGKTHTSAVLVNKGEFNMRGGTISDNEVANAGGGVAVIGGAFNMSGGVISGNTANTTSYGGGGVYVSNQGVFNLSEDGVIKENTVPITNGGGVFVLNGTFNMNGGKLIGNTATSTGGAGHGGAVCVHSKGHFLMSDGEITGSTQEKNTIVLLGSDNSAVVSGGAINGTLQNNQIKLTGGKFSFKPTVNHLGTNAGMLSIMSNTGADATVYPYVVGKGYNRVGEFMDFQSSLNLTITLGADVNFTPEGVSATVNGQSVDPVVGDGFVTVPVSGIVAKAMDDVYTVVVTDGANTLYSEAVSVRELAGEWYADEAHSADKIMLADLINYGIAAQKEFEGKATMTALPGAGTIAVPVWNATEGAGVDAAYTDKVAVSLSLKDKIELNVYVRDEAATVAGVAGTAVTNEAGETVTRFTFDDIAVKDVKNPVAFAVTLSDGSVFNVKYSIADYVIQAQNGTQSDLIKALMKYVDSVSKYLAQ